MKSESLNLSYATAENALRELGEFAYDLNYVENEYIEALLEREANYPTGLEIPSEDYGIAIPHADPDFVLEQAIILGFPSDSVTFRSMDDKEKEIDVDLVLLLLVTEAEGYSTFLSNLTKLFQNSEFAEHVREQNREALLNQIMAEAVDT